ncbi:MAG: NAD-dependent epimerase [Verrucomicrobiales bacterium]|nr:NAD-dependent epimerase [Verrucomicrobiales bacterium]|tara:strand:+ start:10021 stop:11007 length:987 start_codon:yes stop_codon:yes gene_type:complete
MKALVTGSSGHLGEALVRVLRRQGEDVCSIDLLESPFTTATGSILDRDLVEECMEGVDAVFHSATLHKPHVGTHSKREFVGTNITGTLTLLEAAVRAGVKAFIYTSTTSVFGDAMKPGPDDPSVWVTEDIDPVPKNIYGVTKAAAEDLCHLFHRRHGLPCIALRTSRFFPEEDDDASKRESFDPDNLKVIEYLHRRADIDDMVSAHLAAANRAAAIGFGCFIISATTPFDQSHLRDLRGNAGSIVRELVPDVHDVFESRGWKIPNDIGRVYVNEAARQHLGWAPNYDFAQIIQRLAGGGDYRSDLTRQVGVKGYHAETFANGPYPVTD